MKANLLSGIIGALSGFAIRETPQAFLPSPNYINYDRPVHIDKGAPVTGKYIGHVRRHTRSKYSLPHQGPQELARRRYGGWAAAPITKRECLGEMSS